MQDDKSTYCIYTFVFKMIGYTDILKTIKYVRYIIYKDYILTNTDLIHCEYD